MAPADTRALERGRVHVLVFDAPEPTLGAVGRLRQAGFEVADVHSPFPLHGAEEALGLRPTRLALATLVGGLLGGLGKLLFQGWVHVVDWPMNIGGKPDVALPALVPVTFELTVLGAAFATLGAFLFRRRLFPRLAAMPRLPDPRVTDDRFAVLVVERDGSFSAERFHALCSALHPLEVVEGWRVS
jgi:hypothetical protein